MILNDPDLVSAFMAFYEYFIDGHPLARGQMIPIDPEPSYASSYVRGSGGPREILPIDLPEFFLKNL